MTEPVFIVNNLQYCYPTGVTALSGVSFEVREGERLAVLGANASGKSTLLHLMNGLYFPASGYVTAFGTRLTEDSVQTPPFSQEFRQKVGYLFQNSDAQLFNATVEDELAFGPLQLRLDRVEVDRRIYDILKLLGIEHLRTRSPNALSGGEKKKVALAGLLTCAPRVILMDEPSASLDPRTQQWLVEFLGILRQTETTLVISSHDLSFVAETVDRVLIMSEDHKLVFDGPVKEALNDLALLASVNLIHTHVHTHDDLAHEHPHAHQTWHDHKH